jgi:hypothetical protein
VWTTHHHFTEICEYNQSNQYASVTLSVGYHTIKIKHNSHTFSKNFIIKKWVHDSCVYENDPSHHCLLELSIHVIIFSLERKDRSSIWLTGKKYSNFLTDFFVYLLTQTPCYTHHVSLYSTVCWTRPCVSTWMQFTSQIMQHVRQWQNDSHQTVSNILSSHSLYPFKFYTFPFQTLGIKFFHVYLSYVRMECVKNTMICFISQWKMRVCELYDEI